MASLLLTTLLAIATASPINTSIDVLPTIDLGYEVHQALSYNDIFDFYTFSNIPFAQPPLGDLRFAAPQPPLPSNSRTPNNGTGLRTCPQATPGWQSIALPFYLDYVGLQAGVLNGSFDASSLGARLDALPLENEGEIPEFPGYEPTEGETEDCLYLDVLVPRNVLLGRKKPSAPVLVEIYGGAFIGGDKVSVGEPNGVGSPGGLLRRSNDSIIYVAINYRLGAFGFSAGPEFEDEGGVSNIGLLDQRAAIEWVKKYIHLFGGDCDDITLLGESAGGSSIEHQIAAYGGTQGKVPFKRAIAQSPGFVPTRSNNYTDTTYQNFLRYANATSLEDLRSTDTLTLMRANAHQIWDTQAYGSGTYGPVVDGDFVPYLPSILFRDGRFDQDVQILAGQNINEGSYFTSAFLRTDEDVFKYTLQLFGLGQEDAYRYIIDELYPAIYDGSHPYNNWYERASLLVSEAAFICNNYYMTSSAVSNQSYSYQFNVRPGYHGQDVQYTFYADTPVDSSLVATEQVQNASAAYVLQDWIVNFAKKGVPLSEVPLSVDPSVYEGAGNVSTISILPQVGFFGGLGQDPSNNDRCRWWQQALYAPPLES